jgi:hypothetical protein
VSLKLKAYREDRGLTQTQVVDEIYRRAVARGDKPPGLCPVAVSRHENGHKRPSLYYQAWYSDIYRATPEQLGFRVALPGEAAHTAIASLSPTENEDVRRRGFLALLGATALSPLEGKLESIRRGLDLARAPSDLDLDEWERTAFVYCGELSATPPAQLLVHLLADFDEVAKSLDRSGPDVERRRLTHVAGQLAVLIAHSLLSLGEHQAARRWWRTARAAADCAGDPALAAFVHGQQAMLSLYGSSYTPTQVLDVVDEAEAAARGTACAGLASALGARAQALGTLGRTTAARNALKDLRTVVDRLPHHVTSEQRYFFGWPEHRLHHIESYTFTRLGELRDAEEAQEQALAHVPPSWRGPAQIGLHRAACLVAAGDIVEGADHAAGVLQALSDEHRRDGFIQPVGHALLAQLPERARRLPVVQDYRELLAGPAGEQPSVR